MIDQIGVLLKSATGEIGTPKAIWKLRYTAIGYVSSFFSFAVLVKDIMGFDKLDLWIKENWGMVIIAGLIVSCLHNRKRVDCCKKVSNSDMQIAISVRIFSGTDAQIAISFQRIRCSVPSWITSISAKAASKEDSSSGILRKIYMVWMI